MSGEAIQRPIPKAPGYLASALRVFDLSVSEMLWSRRTIFMALVVGAPVLISVVLRLLDALGAPVFRVNGMTMAGPGIFGLMIWVFYLRFTVPVLGVFYGTSLIADEVEDAARGRPERQRPADHCFTRERKTAWRLSSGDVTSSMLPDSPLAASAVSRA